MKIERFEDIKAWQEGRILTKMVFQVTSAGNSFRSHRLRDQIEGAGISTMANIAEGFDSSLSPTLCVGERNRQSR